MAYMIIRRNWRTIVVGILWLTTSLVLLFHRDHVHVAGGYAPSVSMSKNALQKSGLHSNTSRGALTFLIVDDPSANPARSRIVIGKTKAKAQHVKQSEPKSDGPLDHPFYQVYPANGTGVTVDISSQFDASVFNSFCDTDVTLKAVLPIYSTVDKFELRTILRNTLGKWAHKLNCRIFFIAGVSRNETVNAKIADEYYKERDILMMNKLDAYEDLNDKAVTMVTWLSQHCMHVPYVIHLIDDAYINLQMFIDRLDSIGDNNNFILGGMLEHLRATRNSNKHTFVSKKEYPETWFPTFAIGFAYAWPAAVSKRLLSAVYSARFCWIEDVWFTGFVRNASGVELIPFKRTEWKANQNKPIPHLLERLPPWFIVHTVEPELFHTLYSSVAT